MAKKQPDSDFNMSEAIRGILNESPNLSSKEAIEAIQAKYPSAKINKNSFSVAFYTGRKKLGIKSTSGRGRRVSVRKSLSSSGASVDIGVLQTTARFLSEVGGADAAIAAIKHVQAIQVK
jgi:hypothetical protein